MNILFLSYDNRVRSQIAEAFYNYFKRSPVSKSAGFSDEITQRESLDRFVLDCMAEKDINLESHMTKQYRERHADEVRLVVCLSSYDELKTDDEQTRWASAHERRCVDWKIPKANPANIAAIRDEIQKRVLEISR